MKAAVEMHPKLAEKRFARDVVGITPELCEIRGWTLFEMKYPILDIGFTSTNKATMRLRLECEDWSDVPPAVMIPNFDGSPTQHLPAGLSNIFHAGPHPIFLRPFICMRGTREYHMHESHRLDSWDEIKHQSGYRLGEIATQI
jgi:hypothetical protein